MSDLRWIDDYDYILKYHKIHFKYYTSFRVFLTNNLLPK